MAEHFPKSVSESFFMKPTSELEVSAIISRLQIDSAPGWDGISNRIIKLGQKHLAAPITFVCNLSLSTGSVPSQMKIANICPIFKEGDPTLTSNYRPISLLTSVAKILERLVNVRLLDYLEKKDILSKTQFGFRSGRSTEDAVTSLVDYVTRKLDGGEKCVGVFLDLAKAFDTVSRRILLRKLELIGIRGPALNWFTSYLTDRKQRISIGSHQSSLKKVDYGVPQGSVLGPSLFLIYINGLCLLNLAHAQIFAYADDTAIIFHARTWRETYEVAEIGMRTVSVWLEKNLLKLNVQKTKMLNFSVTKRTLAPEQICVRLHSCETSSGSACTCTQLQRVDNIKYLGVIIDQHLSWQKQIEAVNVRIRKLLFIFKRLRSIAGNSTLKMIYYAFCQSILSYCVVSWGAANKTLLISTERVQRAVLKVMLSKKIRHPTSLLYQESQVITVRQLYILAVVIKPEKDKEMEKSKV